MKNEKLAYLEALESLTDDLQFEITTDRLKHFLEEMFYSYLELDTKEVENLSDIYHYIKQLVKFKEQLDELERCKV